MSERLAPERSPGERTLGIIGVGLLGSALAERFAGAGFAVTGYDIDSRQAGLLAALGARPAASAADAASSSRRLLLSLPTSEVVDAVLDEIAPHLAAGTIVIDTTTGTPCQMVAFGTRLAGRGVHYLDATIGGSSRQVRSGEAIVLCGGDPGVYQRCSDLFAVAARQAFYLGPTGSGARMKLVLNLALGLNRAVLAEALSYAAACGIDPSLALDVLKAGPAYSRVMDAKGRKMLDSEFSAEARLSQHLKDVRLILSTGAECDAVLPLSWRHCELLEKAEAAGFGAADNSAIIEVFRKQDT